MNNLKDSTKKIVHAIKNICDEDNLLFESVSFKSDADCLSITAKISNYHDGRNRFERNYLEIADRIDLNPVWLDKIAFKDNQYFKIKGFHKNRYKKPIEILNMSKNKILFLHPDEIRYIWTRFKI